MADDAGPNILPGNSPADEIPKHIQEEAKAILKRRDLIDVLVADIHNLGIAGEDPLLKTIYLVATSRKLPTPCSAIVQSASSSGKTITVNTVARCIPPEDVYNATDITPNALYYMGQDALKHKLVVQGERKKRQGAGQADATAALRQLLSDGQISKLVGKRHIIMNGPIAYIETTTSHDVFEEDLNRCLLLSADESPEQTKRVLLSLARLRSGNVDTSREAIIQRHHALQRMLEPLGVIVPFAEALAANFPTGRPEAHRAFGQLLTMVEASAVLHQFQRERSEGRLIATRDDYSLASELCLPSLARQIGGKISDAATRFYERLRAHGVTQFTTTEAAKLDRKSRQCINTWLAELSSIQAIQIVERGIGCNPAIWRFIEKSGRKSPLGGLSCRLWPISRPRSGRRGFRVRRRS